ncbi:MAG: metallophosphoesterase [Cyclobacteriaceae bacterium]|nr:metallophosphoesterase [Cyclobacteriaceae bacterium]
MKNYYRLFLLSTVLFLFNCTPPAEKKYFISDLKIEKTPWSYEPTGKPDGQFTFAIISDLNGGEREGIFDVAVEQINLLRPEFILSVGDLVNGETEEVTELQKQYDSFDQRAAKAKAPMFHVGGNHDLTSSGMRDFWEKRYGRKYYHFVYQNVLFLVLDTEDYTDEFRERIHHARSEAIAILEGNHPEEYLHTEYYNMPERETGKVEEEQNAYFEKVIASYPEAKYTFVLMHKPVWQREGEGSLSRIENALGDRDYTVINGHYHSYSYTNRNGHDYIMLGTTGGSQNAEDDYSFDHITLVSYSDEGPTIANIRMDGLLNKTGKIPLDGARYCYQASKCRNTESE